MMREGEWKIQQNEISGSGASGVVGVDREGCFLSVLIQIA